MRRRSGVGRGGDRWGYRRHHAPSRPQQPPEDGGSESRSPRERVDCWNSLEIERLTVTEEIIVHGVQRNAPRGAVIPVSNFAQTPLCRCA